MILEALLVLAATAGLQAQGGAPQGFPGLAAGRAPRVEIPWNRFYDEPEIRAQFARLEAQWPELLSHEVIATSVEGREMPVWILNDPASGPHSAKPAMWVDANVHGNEVQGAEAVLYLAWYLLENEGTNERVDELLGRVAFYLLPMVNPDGRAHWFNEANDAHSSRSGVAPLDNDRDGLFDEDGPDDLNGDGAIVQMRKHVPGEGTHRLDPDDPRIMVRVPPDQRGDWIYLGSEGVDDDGDGRVNEDGLGGYDMNRAWPSLWMPDHVQYGAGPYPLYWPETRGIATFIVEHPNIAAVQSFHNAGGMILRGPGAEVYGEYPRQDLRVYDEIGRDGERMLPFYRYMIIWKDLYSVFGGFVTWTYEGLGIISFTNELWSSRQSSPDERLRSSDADELFFDDQLLSGAGFVDWTPVEHPLYGLVEVGGFRKDVGRVPPTFMIEEMIHRNAMFCLRHAEALPEVVIRDPEVTSLGGGVFAIDVVFENRRAIPTRTALAADERIGEPDRFLFAGAGIEVLAGGFRTDRFRPTEIELQDHEPERLLSEDGIGGRERLRVRWIVRGNGRAILRYEGEKARDVERELSF